MTECVDCAFCAPLTDAERDQIFQALLEIVGPRGLVTAPDEIAAASLDSRRRRQGSALALVRAASTEEVSAVVRLAGEWGLCIVPQCGNTSTVGGATPEPESPANRRTIILSLSRMNRILSVDPVNAAMTVEAGVILAKAAEAAREAGYLYPISLAAEGTAEIGGTLAANAGGVHVVRYGMARRSCLGIEVVLADGRVVNLMRSVRKDNTGYDLRDLFIGSEGTLGIITKAVLDLSALPAGRLTVWAPLGSLEAVEKLFQTVEKFAGPALTAFELMSEASLDFVYAEGRTSPTTAKSDWTVLFDLALTGRDDPDNMTEGLIEALSRSLIPVMCSTLCSPKTKMKPRRSGSCAKKFPRLFGLRAETLKMTSVSRAAVSAASFGKPLPNSRKKRRGSPRPFSVTTATATCTSTLGTARSWARGSGSSTNVKSTAW